MQYFVAGNLNHNGRVFQRGDTIELDESAVAQLLEVGVIQTEPVADAPARETAPAAEQPAQPAVSGKPMETGEPSIDGRNETDRQVDNATDITPPVDTGMRALSPDVRAGSDMAPVAGSEAPVEPSEDMTRPELEELAVKEGMTEAEAADTPNKGALIELILQRRTSSTAGTSITNEPEQADPSAGL